MSNDIQFGIRVGYEGGAVTSGATATTKEIRAIGETAKKAGADATRALDSSAVSAKQMSFALRGVPAQFTDIAVSLAAGQNPMQVFLQQGGQLKDMFGGIGPAARALGGYVLGLVNPFTVTAAAAAGLGLAYYQGSKEQDAYTRSLILTGNYAGTTASQLEDAAQRVAAATGRTRGAAAEALAASVGTASVTGDNLAMVAGAALNMQRATGKAIDETVAEFDKLARGPVAASLKLNEQYRYLTAAAYAQIKALDDQGRSTEAAELAIKTYADAMNERSGQIETSLGALERVWHSVASAAKDGWDAMLNIGREDSLAEKIASTEENVASLRARVAAMGAGGIDSIFSRYKQQALAAAEAELAGLKAKAAAEETAAQAKARTQQVDQAGIEWAKEGDKFLSRRQVMEKEINRARVLGAEAGATDLEIQKRIAAIREKYTEKKTVKRDGLDDAARDQAQSYAQQYEAAAKLARGIEAEATAGEKLLPVQRALAEARATLSGAQVREIEMALAGASLIERRTQAEKAAADASKIYGDAVKQMIGPIEERTRLLALERENAGKTEAEINAIALARIIEARAIAAANGALQQHLDFYDREIAARQGLAKQLDAQTAAQADWAAGAVRGLRDYSRESANAADHMAESFKSGAKKAEDAIANFAVKGKLDIRSLLDYVATETARENFAKPIISYGTNWLSGLFNGGGTDGAASGGAGALDAMSQFWTMHTGGIVGLEGTDQRSANPDVFRGATRYHSGGIVGDEVPIIAKRSEGVFTREQMRNLAPAGGAGNNVTVNIIESPNAGGQVKQRNEGGRSIIDVMVAKVKGELIQDVRSDGAFARTAQGQWGLSRAAGAM